MAESHQAKKILYYCGGFHHIGGVESFVAELITSVPDDLGERWVAAWSGPIRRIPILMAVKEKSRRFLRTSFRWGCRFAWPDKVLLRQAREMVEASDVILFPKVFPTEIH